MLQNRKAQPIQTALRTQTRTTILHADPVPAAQYIRMSDEQQQYSLDNQQQAIKEYADSFGFAVVKTYPDPAKTGVEAKHRPGLQQLLRDVQSGNANYKAILVYDVSRWGRFPNNDEAAYYEFICHKAGIPLHYCAEPFANDGTAASSLLKALKRSMAAEFSRELGEKVFRGKTGIVQKGFWVGGQPGYGYRRLMVSQEGRQKQVMKPGEQKSLKTDRVILVPGPRKEVQAVRQLFLLAAFGNGPSAIARRLNDAGITHNGRRWIHGTVRDILNNPKYMGCNVWNRRTQRLHGPTSEVQPQLWVSKPVAFSPLVTEELFKRAQAGLPVPRRWSDEQILFKLRRLLRREGRLSETLILRARGMPSTVTIHNRFGTYRQLYARLGYRTDAEFIHNSEQAERTMGLRGTIVNRLPELFPTHLGVTQLPNRSRSLLLIDETFMVSMVLSRSKQKRGKLVWVVDANPAERGCITLLGKMNSSHDRVTQYFLLPHMSSFKRYCSHDSWFRQAIQLKSLSEFYSVALKLWIGRASQ